VSKSDDRSRKAFEITKNVSESNKETLLNVASGGVVGELKVKIAQLRAELDEVLKMNDEEYRSGRNLREKEFEALRAENKHLRNLMQRQLDDKTARKSMAFAIIVEFKQALEETWRRNLL